MTSSGKKSFVFLPFLKNNWFNKADIDAAPPLGDFKDSPERNFHRTREPGQKPCLPHPGMLWHVHFIWMAAIGKTSRKWSTCFYAASTSCFHIYVNVEKEAFHQGFPALSFFLLHVLRIAIKERKPTTRRLGPVWGWLRFVVAILFIHPNIIIPHELMLNMMLNIIFYMFYAFFMLLQSPQISFWLSFARIESLNPSRVFWWNLDANGFVCNLDFQP